ncbi:MAG: 2-phospho-L-lactate guanylyltransferase [Candidatus Dormibacteria bacterium]
MAVTGPEVGEGPFLVIPVKPFAGAKQRLAARLSGPSRRLVSRALATHVLACAAAAWPCSRLVVVGDDRDTSALCARLGVCLLPDAGAGQSAAVEVGQAWCLARGAQTLVTIPADLPWLETADVESLAAVAAEAPARSLVAFPDRAGTGTNGVVVRPADAQVFHFGPDSLARHREAASRLGLDFSVGHLDHLAWDLDRYEDLEPSQAPAGHPLLAWARQVAELERAAASSSAPPGG